MVIAALWAGLTQVSFSQELNSHAKNVDLKPIVVYLNSSLQEIPDRTRLRSYRLIVQAFYDLGYVVEFAHQPPKRMIASLDHGIIDAICMRAAGMEKLKSKILRVPVSVHKLKLFGYVDVSKRPKSGFWRDASLESVGLSHGAQNPQRYIPEELMKKRFVRTPASITGASMVRAGRLDMMILPEILFHATEPTEKKIFSGLVKLEPELVSIDTYCFLSTLQGHLFEPLTAALKRLKLSDAWQYDDSLYPMVFSDKEVADLRDLPGYSRSSQ